MEKDVSNVALHPPQYSNRYKYILVQYLGLLHGFITIYMCLFIGSITQPAEIVPSLSSHSGNV